MDCGCCNALPFRSASEDPNSLEARNLETARGLNGRIARDSRENQKRERRIGIVERSVDVDFLIPDLVVYTLVIRETVVFCCVDGSTFTSMFTCGVSVCHFAGSDKRSVLKIAIAIT